MPQGAETGRQRVRQVWTRYASWDIGPFCRSQDARRFFPAARWQRRCRQSSALRLSARLPERFNCEKGETRGGGTAPPGPKWAEKPRFFRETTGRMVWNAKHFKLKMLYKNMCDRKRLARSRSLLFGAKGFLDRRAGVPYYKRDYVENGGPCMAAFVFAGDMPGTCRVAVVLRQGVSFPLPPSGVLFCCAPGKAQPETRNL